MSKAQIKKWTISLPIYTPSEVMDSSTIGEYGRCMRKGFYRYGLRRVFSGAPREAVIEEGSPNADLKTKTIPSNYPIAFGSAYHRYREVVELECEKQGGIKITKEIHLIGLQAAMELFDNPPIGHKYEWLDTGRLISSCNLAFQKIQQEHVSGRIKVTRSEEPFDLELPFTICSNCGHTNWDNSISNECCFKCGILLSPLIPRHGGRVDQHILYVQLKNQRMIRDFKTTSYKGKYYEEKFDPNLQMQGYAWSGEELSGEEFGALIETLYNTKNQGPEITQHYVTYSRGQQAAWLASVMMERQFIQTSWSRIEELGYLAFPMRTSECSSFGGCPYRDGCRSGSAFELNKWLENYTVESHWDFSASTEGEEV